MKYTSGGANVCIRDDDEKILTPDATSYDLLMPLVDLTHKTKDTHCTHDFITSAVGKGVMNDFLLPSHLGGVREMHLFSLNPIKNGDTIVCKDGKGAPVARLVFDVEMDPRQKSLFKVNAVKHTPDLRIGHKMPQQVAPTAP